MNLTKFADTDFCSVKKGKNIKYASQLMFKYIMIRRNFEHIAQNLKLKLKYKTDLNGSFNIYAESISNKQNHQNYKFINDPKEQQRAFNKYVKYEVIKLFGEDALSTSQIRDLNPIIMKKIKGMLF